MLETSRASLFRVVVFFMIADDDGNHVDITGCGNGFDWTIQHEDGFIRHTAETGERGLIDAATYKKNGDAICRRG